METGGPHGWGSEEWKELLFVLLEVATDTGLVGWGESWAKTLASFPRRTGFERGLLPHQAEADQDVLDGGGPAVTGGRAADAAAAVVP